jgi:hypothetical protein
MRVLPVLGGVTFGLYYWFGAPGFATAYHLPDVGATIIRVAMLALVVVWLIGALRVRPARTPASLH